jgi:hypothetical protein
VFRGTTDASERTQRHRPRDSDSAADRSTRPQHAGRRFESARDRDRKSERGREPAPRSPIVRKRDKEDEDARQRRQTKHKKYASDDEDVHRRERRDQPTLTVNIIEDDTRPDPSDEKDRRTEEPDTPSDAKKQE